MRHTSTLIPGALRVVLLGMGALGGLPAHSQEQPQQEQPQQAAPAQAQAQAQADDSTLAPVIVTGTLLKTTDAGIVPVTSISAAQIEQMGAMTQEQLLQTVPAALQGNDNTVAATGSGATSGGISTVSLRGLGSQRTLVLIDGWRVAGGGSIADSTSVDINSIPVSALQRVDVDEEGASAIYGSDAIAGVVNYVLRDDFEGAQVNTYGGDSTDGGGSIKHADALLGLGNLARDGFNVMFSSSFEQEGALYGADRSFADTGINEAAGNDSTSLNSYPANVVSLGTAAQGNAFQGNPRATDCAPSITNDPLGVPGLCSYDPSAAVSLLPATQRYNLFSAAHLALTSDIQLYTELSYYQGRERYSIEPDPISDEFSLPSNNPLYNEAPYDGFQTINLAPSSPYYPTAWVQSQITPGAPLPVLDVYYRSVITGDRVLTDSQGQPRALFGVKGDADGWSFDGGFLWSQTQLTEYDDSGYPQTSLFLPLLNSGTVNFFGPNDPSVIAAAEATDYVGTAYSTKTTIGEFDGHASRDLVALPAGPLEMAVDVTARKEMYATDPSAALQDGDINGYGGNFFPQDQQRNVFGGGMEFQVPIVGTLAADPAVRYDHYQNSGAKTTPKIGLRWKPLDELLLRGSYSQGFRAPSLSELYAPQTLGVTTPGLSDPARCPTTGSAYDCNTQFNTVVGGNPNLRPETSDTLTAGFVFQPVENLSLGADGFDIRLQNTIIYGIDAADILANPGLFGDLITRAAPDASCPGCLGRILSIAQTDTNFGETEVKGVDTNVHYRTPSTAFGTFKFSLEGTFYSTYREEQPDGTYLSVVGMVSPITNGNGGVIPRWHQFMMVNWDYGPWELTLDNDYQSSYADLPSDITYESRTVAYYTTTDVQAAWSGIDRLRLAVGARNVFDKNPPYTNAGGTNYFQAGYDPGYADPRGRFVYGMVTYSVGPLK